jgi:GNAT superfamily N-acetyltransferase
LAVEPGGQSVGAAWLRLFSDDDRGYGFVAADVPELTLGVVEHWRGKGVGRALLEEVVREAAGAGFGSISLSVERANHAALLYASVGFTVVESGRDSDTMVNITGAQL